jgi:DNA-directed RNA polymerase subunit F
MLLLAGAAWTALPAMARERGFGRSPAGIQMHAQQQQPSWRGPGGPPPSTQGGPRKGLKRPHIGQWLKKNQNLSPQDQEKALASDPEFQKLPPEKQSQLKERLREFNNLPPEQRQRILQRMDAFEHLTPEQQEQARQIFGQVRQMPEDQRRRFREGMHQLADAKPEQRQAMLDSPEFHDKYTDEERGLMHQFVSLNVLPPERIEGEPAAPQPQR